MVGFLLSPAGRLVLGAGAAIALAGGIWLHGHSTGQAKAEARHTEAVRALERNLSAVSDMARFAESERLRIERERDALLDDLDAAGDAADGAGRIALPADSVRRIDAIGRAP
jgi:hypothetical protein